MGTMGDLGGVEALPARRLSPGFEAGQAASMPRLESNLAALCPLPHINTHPSQPSSPPTATTHTHTHTRGN